MKVRAILAAVATLFATLVFGVAASSAHADPYPPVPKCYSLSLSTTNPAPGETVTVVGKLFSGNATVTFVLRKGTEDNTTGEATLGTAKTDASGSVTFSFVMPTSTYNEGSFWVVATSGYVKLGGCVDPATELLAPQSKSDSGTGSGTAFTGVDIALLVAVAVALLASGAFLARRGRRRSDIGAH